MKTTKRLLSFLFVLVVCVMALSFTCFAQGGEQYGVDVKLTTDKVAYNAGEEIKAELYAYNTVKEPLENVSLQITFPEDFYLDNGSLNKAEIKKLELGEQIDLQTFASTKTQSEKKAIEQAKIDQRNDVILKVVIVTVCAVVFIIAAVLIIVFVPKTMSKPVRITALTLCVAIPLLVALSLSAFILYPYLTRTDKAQADNSGKLASGYSQIIQEEEITVEGKKVKVIATVRYKTPKEKVQETGEISYKEVSSEHIQYTYSTGVYYADNGIELEANDGVSKKDIDALVSKYSGKVVGYIEFTNDAQIEFSQERSYEELEEICTELVASGSVSYASPLMLYDVEENLVPNDSEYESDEWNVKLPEGNNWALVSINAPQVWDYINVMKDVSVGVIDSCFYHHDDLEYERLWLNPSEIDPAKGKNHATHVSGTIAAKVNNEKGVAGVAPTAKIHGYCYFGGSGTASAEAELPKPSMAMKKKCALSSMILADCKVINMSLGLTNPNKETSEKQAEQLGRFIKKYIDSGYDFLICQSAGNKKDNAYNNGSFCAVTDEELKSRIIIVGAYENLGSTENLWGLSEYNVHKGYRFAESFSNYGEQIDILAPGVDVLSTIENNEYAMMEGTSMAAPHVTGTAAACFAVNPNLKASDVKNIILSSAQRTVEYKGEGESDNRSYKLLDAGAAVEAAKNFTGTVAAVKPKPAGAVIGALKKEADNKNIRVNVTAYRIETGTEKGLEYVRTTISDEDLVYDFILEPGHYALILFVDGYEPLAMGNIEVKADETTYLPDAWLVKSEDKSKDANLNVITRDAINDEIIGGVSVTLRYGWENKTGPIVKLSNGQNAVGTTDENGELRWNIESGVYTAEFTKDGYIKGYANVVARKDYTELQKLVLSPKLPDDEYRIVLTWDISPNDLDSHISGPGSDSRFHVFYSQKNYYEGDFNKANLDHDDMHGNGHETVTVKKVGNGTYKYSVHDYSNRSSSNSNAMSEYSNARVQVYSGNNLVATYDVPKNKAGTVWNVFEIRNGQVVTINTMGFESTPSDVVN